MIVSNDFFFGRGFVQFILGVSVLFLPCLLTARSINEVYVWQRADSGDLRKSIKWGRDYFENFNFLLAEAVYHPSETWQWTSVSHQAWHEFKSSHFAVSIRINFKTEPGDLDKAFLALSDQTCQKIKPFLSAEKGLSEVQIDFDAKGGQLRALQKYLNQIRSCIAPSIGLTFTALGSWLKEADFADLARAYPNYVLQVHFFSRLGEQDYSIYQSQLAKEYGDMANALGVPFRLALPAYTYYVVLDQKKNIRSLEAEGLQTVLESTWERKFVAVDFSELQKDLSYFGKKWSKLRNVIWFRLPLKNDENTLSQSALAKMLTGQAIDRTPVHIEVKNNDKKLFDLVAKGSADIAGALPDRITLTFPASNRILAWEIHSLCSKVPSVLNELVLNCARRYDDRKRYLPPNKIMSIGWVRLKDKSSIPNIKTDFIYKK